MNILFQGSSLDIYIHWLILSLGIGIFVSGVAVVTSCRSIAGYFHLIKSDNSPGTRFYKAYYRYHSLYWTVFWYILAAHLLVTIYHIGRPATDEPFLLAHQVVFYTALGNLLLVMVVLSSCRSIVSVLNIFMAKSPLSNNAYKQFYRYHSHSWWLLAASIGGHIVSGLIHAINT